MWCCILYEFIKKFESEKICCGKCSKILNTSSMPKRHRQTGADPDQTASEEAV